MAGLCRSSGGRIEAITEWPHMGGQSHARELALEDLFCPVCGRPLEIEAIPRAPPPLDLAKYLGPIL